MLVTCRSSPPHSCLVVAFVTAALAVINITAGSQERERTFLGVMRQDGLLIPIAIYDGQEWWNRWPWAAESDEIKALPIPASLEDIPQDWLPPGGRPRLPIEWILLGTSGALTRVQVGRPVRPSTWQLMDTIGLQTNYRVRPDKTRGLYDYDEIGVAIAGAGELGRFQKATRGESQRIITRLMKRLLNIENEGIARWLQERREMPDAARDPVTLTRTFRGDESGSIPTFTLTKAVRPINGRTYYYLDGEKLYLMGLKRHPDCKMNLSFEGVVIANRDGEIFSETVHAAAWAEYCGDRASWMDPLATLHLKDRVIWIVKYSVEDGYDYGLFDPDANRSVEPKGSWELRR